MVEDAATRSRNMQAIRSRDTAPELTVRRFLHAAGLRYRLHVRKLPGVPDIVFPRRHALVFVHGCFWHQHRGCKDCRTPKQHADYWAPKLQANVQRDARNTAALCADGWNVFVIWECEAGDQEALVGLAQQIRALPIVARD